MAGMDSTGSQRGRKGEGGEGLVHGFGGSGCVCRGDRRAEELGKPPGATGGAGRGRMLPLGDAVGGEAGEGRRGELGSEAGAGDAHSACAAEMRPRCAREPAGAPETQRRRRKARPKLAARRGAGRSRLGRPGSGRGRPRPSRAQGRRPGAEGETGTGGEARRRPVPLRGAGRGPVGTEAEAGAAAKGGRRDGIEKGEARWAPPPQLVRDGLS